MFLLLKKYLNLQFKLKFLSNSRYIIKIHPRSKSTRSKSTRLKKLFSLFINKFKKNFEIFLFYIYLLFTITNTPNPYLRPVSGSRVFRVDFDRVDFERGWILIVYQVLQLSLANLRTGLRILENTKKYLTIINLVKNQQSFAQSTIHNFN